MPRLVVRPATREDIEGFADMAERPTVRAIVGEIEGRIVGMGGFALLEGRWVGFCDLTADVRPYKMTIMRAAKRLMGQARRDGVKFVYADVDANEPRAHAWLASLGFEPDLRSARLYRWSA